MSDHAVQSFSHPSRKHTLFGIKVLSIFAAVLFLEIPLVWLFQWLVTPGQRSYIWRIVAHKNCHFFLRLWGVKVKMLYQPQPSAPVIFACNHPTNFDGLILFALLGPDVIALTAPFGSFAFPLGFWFKRMGFVDIQRDANDAANHPAANTKAIAFTKLLHYLQSGTSIFMFPEGHVERGHQLHYIHTGVARLSLQAHVPVQVLSLVGMEKTALGMIALASGTLTLRFAKLIEPPALSHYLPFRKVVKPYARDIERRLITLLPVRYLPDYYRKKPEGVAAFFDIDRTLYLGYSQQDFVRYLLKKKLLPKILPLRVAYWIALEKLHLIPHRQLMKLAYGSLGGLSVKTITELCERFFQEVAIQKINHHVLPVIKDHRSKGHMVIIVTEVFHPLARIFQKYIEASTSLDSVLTQQHGVYTGEVEILNYGYTKAEQVEEFSRLFSVDLKRSYAYADSSSDLPLLYTCRHKIPVNPDKHLLRVAEQQHWQTL